MRIHVATAAEAEQDAQRKRSWGDYWFGESLKAALVEQGHEIDAGKPEVLIHCYGLPAKSLPDWTYNILYIHSHPDGLTKEYVSQYDKVYCLSPLYLARLYDWGIDAELAVGASDYAPIETPIAHDVVFVANAKGYKDNSRAIIQAMGDLSKLPFKLEVWGEGWGWMPDGIWQGAYYPNERLNELYSSSAVVLNDEHDDMQREGFINPRVLDALSAGSMVVTLPNKGYTHLGLPVTIFESVTQVAGLVAARKAGKAWPAALQRYTFDELARRLTSGISEHRLCVDLGCGAQKRLGFIGIDKMPQPGVDIVWDITNGWPATHGWYAEYNQVDYIVADNLFEHIGEPFIYVMNELHRAIKEGGRLRAKVPSVTNTAAFQDPTHVRYFAPETWDYFDAGNSRWQNYGKSYGIRPWKLLWRALNDRFIEVIMEPVKDAQ